MDVAKLSQEERDLLNGIYARIKNTNGWIKSPVLQKEYNISGAEVRKCIHTMRSSNLPIISGGKGYKFARTEAELNQCISSLYSRVRSIAEAARGLVGAKDELYSGQTSIEFEMIDNLLQTANTLEHEDNLFRYKGSPTDYSNDGAG